MRNELIEDRQILKKSYQLLDGGTYELIISFINSCIYESQEP